MAMHPIYQAHDWMVNRTTRGVLLALGALHLAFVEWISCRSLWLAPGVLHTLENGLAVAALTILAPPCLVVWQFIARESLARQWIYLAVAISSAMAMLASAALVAWHVL